MSALEECSIHRAAIIVSCRECAERNPNIRQHHDAYVAAVRENHPEEIPMTNAFAEGNVASAAINIERAIEWVGRLMSTDLPGPDLINSVLTELLAAKGKLVAAQQLEELQRTLDAARAEVAKEALRALGAADTQRPSHLRVVR